MHRTGLWLWCDNCILFTSSVVYLGHRIDAEGLHLVFEKVDAVQDAPRPFWQRCTELSTHEGYVLWGGRVVVPERGWEYVLTKLHGGHPGMMRMRALARALVWWPCMIERAVKDCPQCQEVQLTPPIQPMQPWSWPTRPLSQLHIDFAGPLHKPMFQVIADAHTKWIDVVPMKTATALTTVQRLRTVFANMGVPESAVTENGPQFAAVEFQEFCRTNSIEHILTAPYHPASNGLTERGVRTFKEGYRKLEQGTVSNMVAHFLLQCQVTPHSTTRHSPSELVFSRNIRTCQDTLQPDLSQTVECKQHQRKSLHDSSFRHRNLVPRDKVYVRNF